MAPVLLAIRNPGMRETLCHLLREEAGYEVIETHNGLSTLTALWTSPQPLVVLLDAQLDGHDAAERLLRLAMAGGPAGRHQYAIYTSFAAQDLPPQMARYAARGGIHILAVPFAVDDLLRVVMTCQMLLPLPRPV